jgi:protoporphyrinogen oxidase
MKRKPHIIILGAGPAGLGAAFQLSQRQTAKVTVVEQENVVGGNAASFEISGLHVDYGSHRLHPACDPGILADIKDLLGEDLLNRPRHGRIRLRNRWIHFPLRPLDLLWKMPPGFAAGTAVDLLGKTLSKKSNPKKEGTFASALEEGLGKTICREFYFPYAQKIWGFPPQELSAAQARRRVSAGSIGKMVLKVLSAVPAFKGSGNGRFFYPRRGFGQISERLYQSSKNLGAKFILGAKIESISLAENRVKEISIESDGQVFSERPSYLWSTIPVPNLLNYFRPPPPSPVSRASDNLRYRGMILIYLSLEQAQFTEYDAHYFPEPNIPITRLSEPKNYANLRDPQDKTVLCAELPCSPAEPEWQLTDEKLGRLVLDCLKSVDLPIKVPIQGVTTQRLYQAYPVYQTGYEAYLERIDRWLSQIENLVTFGRQGLFIHDNTHHALHMAYSAANSLNSNGFFDRARWRAYRKTFETFVVED